MDTLTAASTTYMATFSGYVSQFLTWGKWLFLALLTINIALSALWYAFDRHSFSESMPAFLKELLAVGFFFALMTNHGWLSDLLTASHSMGSTLTHTQIDPSSLISQGIAIGNKVILPIAGSSLLSVGFGLFVAAAVYAIVLFAFISIALDLALTLIITTALIAVSPLFLAFSALGATSAIARQTLDVILANCVKLLGIYLVVAAGSQTMNAVVSTIPVKTVNFDSYAWVVAGAMLFWLVAKNLPNQLAKIVSGAIQENRGTDAAAIAMTAIRMAQHAMPAAKVAGSAALSIAKLAGGTLNNAGANLKQGIGDNGLARGSVTGAVGTAEDVGKAVMGNLADRFKNISTQLAGGQGRRSVQSVAERLYQSSQNKGAPPTNAPKA